MTAVLAPRDLHSCASQSEVMLALAMAIEAGRLNKYFGRAAHQSPPARSLARLKLGLVCIGTVPFNPTLSAHQQWRTSWLRKTLNELFLDTLKDIYYAEKQILKALPKMAKAANSDKLRAEAAA